MIRKTDKSVGLASGLLLGAAAVTLMALSAPVGAQGWTAELSDIAKNPPPARKRRAKPAVATAKAQAPGQQTAKTGAPAPAKSEAAKAAAAKARPVAASVAAVTDPAKAEAASAPAAEPAKAEQARPQAAAEPAVTGAEPAMAANPLPGDDIANQDAEPDDPFADLKVMSRPDDGQVLTTQVLPGENRPAAEAVPPADRGAAALYCTNIADAAIDARIAWQRQNLAEAEKEVQRRTTELEVKTAEYQRWLTRRDEFAERARKSILDIYSKMKPDAAALQLQALDDETAAAVIMNLEPRVASAVMNEMEPVQAARLTAILSAAGKGPGSRPRQAPPVANRS